jgi:hypothetical protein
MAVKDEVVLHRYGIEVVGDKAARNPTGKKLKRVIQLLLEEHLGQYGHNIVTDFKSNLLSKIELEVQDEYVVTYRTEDEDNPAVNARTYRICLKSTGKFTVSQLMDYLTSSNASQLFGSKEEIIQALKILVGHYPKEAAHIASIGANKHFRLDATSTERFDLGEGLTALRGFFISVRAATARILVNVQVKHGAFYNHGPLDVLMHVFLSKKDASKTKLWNFVKKLSVDVTHIVKKNKTGKRVLRLKRLNGFATRDDGHTQQHPPIVPHFGAGSKEVQFFFSDSSNRPSEESQNPSKISSKGGKGKGKGKEKATASGGSSSSSPGKYISVYDYFKQSKHQLVYKLLNTKIYLIDYPQVTIKDPMLPVVNVGDGQSPSYLPPDVCIVQPGQPSKSKLTPYQTQQMIKFAVRRPDQNVQSIVTTASRMLGFDPNNSTLVGLVRFLSFHYRCASNRARMRLELTSYQN